MASSPKVPDPNKSAVAGAQADLANYPFRAQIDALAQMGGSGTLRGDYFDFTGLGSADVQNALSDQMAQALLDIQNNYGAEFIKQRLASLQQSDPAGYAARKELLARILADADQRPDRPLAEDTQKQVMALLEKGSTLSTGSNSETEAVQQGVRGQQLARGIYLGNAPASQEATALVEAGDQMEQTRQNQALSYLQSGISPDDVEYRRIQQSLSNLGSAIAGQSPTAQFSSLAAAGNGAAPFSASVTTPQVNTGAAAQGLMNASQIYSGQVNWANQQINPWTAGLSTGLNAYGTAKAFNWNQPAVSGSVPASWTDAPGYNFSASDTAYV